MPVKHLWNLLFKASPTKVFFTLLAIGLLFAGIFYSRHLLNVPQCTELKSLLDHQPGNIISPTSDSQKVLLHSQEALFQYYQENNYSLIWISAEKPGLLPQARNLIERLEKSYQEGLEPSDYHLEQISILANALEKNDPLSIADEEKSALLDLMLSDAFITYASHQYAGRIHSSVFNTEWSKHIKEINPMDSLVLLDQGVDMNAILDAFSCPYSSYKQLQDYLAKYYTINDYENISEDSSVKLITLNMERWRWLQRGIPETYLMADIANFSLTVVKQGADTLDMKIITGKLQQRTPIFEASLAYIVLNPWWEIPSTIAKKEMLPEIKKDTSYLSKNHIKVYNRKIPNTEVALNDVDWDTITENNFNYKLRQLPGSWNALGEIKFIFPNKHDIYFHDTPHRELFSNAIRAFSHGCIRIEKPVELAAFLLQKDSTWISNKIDNKKEVVLAVPSFPKVFICYWTAWVNADGELCQAPDIYGYDKELEQLWNAPINISQKLSV